VSSSTDVPYVSQVSKLQAGVGFVFDEKRTLRPYKWAQHLSGIDFLPETPPLLPESGSSEPKGFVIASALTTYRQQHRVFTVLQQLRARKKAHVALK
jgi:THO complex subunit 5